ncbi:MAG: Nif3-like dinuclear metal center hexameric protein [Paludibacteraceae bacterium]|nr:Nif3-like dinuclear metal center hexameric protein [Paludibacteraceae bacterium]
MTTREIVNIIESEYPKFSQEIWDNSGLLIDNENAEATGILICFDITEDSINEAIEKNCNFIVSHHPLFINGLKKISQDTYTERCVRLAIKNDIAIYCCHTPVDKSRSGISFKMAEKLGLENVDFLSKDADKDFGLGIVGELTQAMNPIDFIALVKETFAQDKVRYSLNKEKPIKKVAFCGGSGASLINSALKAKADAYICGDIKHHDFFSSQEGILLIDAGHFETEIAIKDLFFSVFSKKIPNFAVYLAKTDKSPIKYF